MTIREFTKTYGDRTVLQFPGMELDPGTIYAVIGPNGCGKSTLAKVLAGAEKPDGKGTAKSVFWTFPPAIHSATVRRRTIRFSCRWSGT